MQSVLEEVELMGIAIAIVFLEETFRTVNPSASVASGVGYHNLVFLALRHLQIAVALLVRTDSPVGVLQGLRILLDFLVLLPGVEGQFGVEPAAFVKEFVALFVGALHTLEDADFIDDVLVEAGCAELMVALGHGDHFIKRDLTLAYGAFNSIKFT